MDGDHHSHYLTDAVLVEIPNRLPRVRVLKSTFYPVHKLLILHPEAKVFSAVPNQFLWYGFFSRDQNKQETWPANPIGPASRYEPKRFGESDLRRL